MSSLPKTNTLHWRRVCRIEEVQIGKPLGVNIAGNSIGIFRIGEHCHAISDICTHEYALLSEGWQDGDLIECPLHQAKFSVIDGKCHGPLAEQDLQVYETDIQNGELYILIEPPAPDEK